MTMIIKLDMKTNNEKIVPQLHVCIFSEEGDIIFPVEMV
jgi:hypothetical protein